MCKASLDCSLLITAHAQTFKPQYFLSWTSPVPHAGRKYYPPGNYGVSRKLTRAGTVGASSRNIGGNEFTTRAAGVVLVFFTAVDLSQDNIRLKSN